MWSGGTLYHFIAVSENSDSNFQVMDFVVVVYSDFFPSISFCSDIYIYIFVGT